MVFDEPSRSSFARCADVYPPEDAPAFLRRIVVGRKRSGVKVRVIAHRSVAEVVAGLERKRRVPARAAAVVGPPARPPRCKHHLMIIWAKLRSPGWTIEAYEVSGRRPRKTLFAGVGSGTPTTGYSSRTRSSTRPIHGYVSFDEWPYAQQKACTVKSRSRFRGLGPNVVLIARLDGIGAADRSGRKDLVRLSVVENGQADLHQIVPALHPPGHLT